ncbi:mitotic spindle assembly checkpoint protein MAD2A [Pseudomyrmex gracilis]|uniref:mitotic spindle assembly checkpoint protein MAD2A n=1 Tax=Pseudomyrmex gracilis TaxID=219809 RepID=UPI0009958144|nr:mitotic spindle assembly checkpoint protein MAD2A [Pseudomyrmex gracilis]
MTETQQKAKCITLKGSAELVAQYLLYGVNSILYQRGVYPPETFQTSEHFGLFIFTSTDKKITSFLDAVLEQVQEWLVQRKVRKITLVITNVNTKEVLEKWDFKVDYEDNQKTNGVDSSVKADLPQVGTKDIKTIQKEIREVMRQITGTVSFLPLLDCLCSFDILTYTEPDCSIPDQWNETQPVFIANSQEVQLRSFSTSIHKMNTVVSYKNT